MQDCTLIQHFGFFTAKGWIKQRYGSQVPLKWDSHLWAVCCSCNKMHLWFYSLSFFDTFLDRASLCVLGWLWTPKLSALVSPGLGFPHVLPTIPGMEFIYVTESDWPFCSFRKHLDAYSVTSRFPVINRHTPCLHGACGPLGTEVKKKKKKPWGNYLIIPVITVFIGVYEVDRML